MASTYPISTQLITKVGLFGLSAQTLRGNKNIGMLLKNTQSQPAEVICQFPQNDSPLQSSHAQVLLT